MSLQDIWQKINPNSGKLSNIETLPFDTEGKTVKYPLLSKFYLASIVVLIATLSFGIGRLSVVGERAPIRIEYDQSLISNTPAPTNDPPSISNQPASAIKATSPQTNSPSATQTAASGAVVVSKNGSKYHYPHCTGAKQIKEENKISFASASAAEAAGYTLAGNCKPR
jgi:hypothetical protein